MMERSRAANPSASGSRSWTGPVRLISGANARSRRARSRVPLISSSSPFMGRWPEGRGGADSGELGHELGELVAREAQLVLAQVLEWRLWDVLGGAEVL